MEVDAMLRQCVSIPIPACWQMYDERNPTTIGVDSDDGELFRKDIRRRAYEISLARRGVPGDARADWFQAETELLGCRFRGLS
jgi:hypothetical protein